MRVEDELRVNQLPIDRAGLLPPNNVRVHVVHRLRTAIPNYERRWREQGGSETRSRKLEEMERAELGDGANVPNLGQSRRREMTLRRLLRRSTELRVERDSLVFPPTE